MKLQHVSDEAYLDYVTGEMSAQEQAQFDAHLQECVECSANLRQYQEIVQSGLTSLDEFESGYASAEGKLPWSIAEGKQKLVSAASGEANAAEQREAFRGFALQGNRTRTGMSRVPSPLAIAAAVILSAGITAAAYHLEISRNHKTAAVIQQPNAGTGISNAQLAAAIAARDTAQNALQQQQSQIDALQAQLAEVQKQMDASNSSSRSEQDKLRLENQTLSAQRDTLARTIQDQQANLASTRQKLDAMEHGADTDALRMTSLENQNHLSAESLKQKDTLINQQQQMLAADRDIRDLMGARDLLMAEVYDVGVNGKRNKPYGRVFYTKGKSLIFYAYDLDQAPGIKNASTFQAWGMRGPDRQEALNLGVMYVDNTTNKRWVLRFDNQQALQQINAVFVTVEPNGESRAPRGKQVLFAFLDEVPNHP